MTTTTSSSTDLDGLLAAVLATPPWTDEPAADRLTQTIRRDPSAARPLDLFEEANRSDWDEARTIYARLRDGECHAAVRRRVDDIVFHVRRIAALLGRCVDVPADIAERIRNQLRDGLLRNETRTALVGILRAAGASPVARITMSDENDDVDRQADATIEPTSRATSKSGSKQRQCALAELQAFLRKRHTAKILNACAEQRHDLKAVAEAAHVTEQIVKNYSAELHRHKLWKQDEDRCWILTPKGFEQLAKQKLEVNPTAAQLRERKKQLRDSARE